ncbi:MAG TPA: undecaprenyl-diphosphate phosphatase [Candidatus Binataceae bacterium]|jgi:undecaprenyl-diphosphatase|nr:undecaprenyl-diphosphate phosphatase [Candidatus Binataceae bacterium]
MISYLQAIVLGAVQGLAEFLPISSSAHLILVPWLLKWQDPGLAFDVALHLGTLLALLIYYRDEWIAMARSVAGGQSAERRLLQLLVVASVPGAIIGLAFEKQAETTFRSPLLIAIAMAVLAVLLWLFDKISPQKRTMSEMTYWDALVIGFSQALAIIPGVSRSGATITMARAVGVERGDSANFSFLMATPIIAGAGLVEARKLFHEGLDWSVGLGFISAAVFGLVAIAFLIRYVRTRDYVVFAVYRLLVAALVIAVFFARS